MNKLKLTLLHLFCLVNFAKAQCDPVVVSNVSTGCAPLEVEFVCLNMNIGIAVWSTGTSTAGGLLTTIVFSTPAVYIVTVTTLITIQNVPCPGTATIAINVVTGPAFGCSTTVGMQEIFDETQLSIFPNPAAENLTVSSPGSSFSGFMGYSLTNYLGQNIREEDVQGNSFSVPIANLTPGLYQIHIKTQYGSVTKKFVKAH
jgi:hypothetical protein